MGLGWWEAAPLQVHRTIHPRSASPLHKELSHLGKPAVRSPIWRPHTREAQSDLERLCSGVPGRSPARGRGVP